MKIEHKLTNSSFNNFSSKDKSIQFCVEEFRFYFKFGNRNTVFFIISDRKPRHNESFKLIKGTVGNTYWLFADFDFEEYPEEEQSPWTTKFDRYLNDNFDINEPVYIWVEYE